MICSAKVVDAFGIFPGIIIVEEPAVWQVFVFYWETDNNHPFGRSLSPGGDVLLKDKVQQ